jgi:cyclophilin family peptidyl-prolyl cis-trans isomerase
MTRRIQLASILLVLVSVFVFTSCRKKGLKPPEEKQADSLEQFKREQGMVEKKEEGPPPTPVVRPPTAADLETYTRDLPGTGPLQAAIHTSMGTFHCELLDKIAPMTVANFVGLATGKHAWIDPRTREVEQKPYYNGIIFHRVIPEFMIQGGDPLGIGSGGPGYNFGDEADAQKAKHDRGGVLSMANAGPGTNGSQFFITETPQEPLDGKHTVFGYCAEVDLVKKISRVERGPDDRPQTDVVIEKIEITRGAPAKGGAPTKGDAPKKS